MAASAKDCCVETAWEQGGWRRKGVDSPAAVNGLLGRRTKQLRTVALRAVAALTAVEVAPTAEDVAVPPIDFAVVRVLLNWLAVHCAASDKRTTRVLEVNMMSKILGVMFRILVSLCFGKECKWTVTQHVFLKRMY